MKNLKIFIILIMIAGITGVSGNAFALSQPNIECQSGSICVHPGDFITYSTEFDKIPAIETYTFGDFIGTDKVSVSITSISNGTKIQSNNILDLKTGFYNETADGSGIPILVMAPTPINVDKNTLGVSEKTQNFNGSKRDVVFVANNTETTTNEIGYDKERGVLMYLHLISHKSTNTDISVLDLNFPTKYDLINTNMFANSGTQSDLQIPSWIKNNAKWWAQGSLTDDDFTKGIQYMIHNGIMKIPHTQSDSSLSHQIPSWVKTNAGWWASGQTSDNDFVKGIQYLVNSGIIHV
ncbi:MAG: hypothetical protein D4R72_04755 [Nitrosopumilales archaeon]|nr:MAG: hypothetical protein D4R72_04755 [Nitrosopumilales archaeon]